MGSNANAVHREPWNKGKIVGQKAPFKLKDIWALGAERHTDRLQEPPGPADFHRQGVGSERRRRRAGGCGRQVGGAAGAQVIADASYYVLTPNGLQAGVAVAGTKYWKHKELN